MLKGRSIKKMSRKLIFAIVSVVAVLVLALGIGMTVLAADETPTPTPPVAITTQETVLQRVATILGVTTDEMINAVAGAKQALIGQKPTADVFYAKVAELLGKGITKDQVIAAMKQAGIEAMDAKTDALLDRAVTAGKISSEEGKQIKDWLAARPSAVDKLIGGFRGFGGRCWGFMKSGIGGFGGMGRFGGQFQNGPKNLLPKASPGTK
jgi:hypothetical protein